MTTQKLPPLKLYGNFVDRELFLQLAEKVGVLTPDYATQTHKGVNQGLHERMRHLFSSDLTLTGVAREHGVSTSLVRQNIYHVFRLVKCRWAGSTDEVIEMPGDALSWQTKGAMYPIVRRKLGAMVHPKDITGANKNPPG